MVGHAPLGHDGAATRDDAGAALGREVDVGQAHAGVDGEVVHALLGLLDQGVAEDLPGQVFGNAAHFFQRLVDGYGANRHGRVAHDPVARGVDVLAGRQVHHVVGTPTDGPDQLFHLFLDARGHGRVADVGVDLDLEIAPNRHGLDLGVVDVGRDDGAAARHFVAHEFGRDDLGDGGAQAVAGQTRFPRRVLLVLRHPFAAAILAQGHVFHLGRDDAALGVVHLGHVLAGFGAARLALQRGRLGAQLGHARVFLATLAAVVQRHARAADVELAVAARFDPGAAHAGQALAHVDMGGGVGVGARGVIDADLLAIGQRDVAHRHAQIGVDGPAQVAFGGCRKWLARLGQQVGETGGIGGIAGGGRKDGIGGVHRSLQKACEVHQTLRGVLGRSDGVGDGWRHPPSPAPGSSPGIAPTMPDRRHRNPPIPTKAATPGVPSPKRQNPSARGAWGLLCLGMVGTCLALQKPMCLSIPGPASGSRSSSAGMNRIKFVGFAGHCFHSGSHLSAFAHPGAAVSIGASAPALDTGQTPRLSASKPTPALARYAPAAINAENQTTMALAEPTCLRSSNFWILPVLVFGSSPNTTARGTL